MVLPLSLRMLWRLPLPVNTTSPAWRMWQEDQEVKNYKRTAAEKVQENSLDLLLFHHQEHGEEYHRIVLQGSRYGKADDKSFFVVTKVIVNTQQNKECRKGIVLGENELAVYGHRRCRKKEGGQDGFLFTKLQLLGDHVYQISGCRIEKSRQKFVPHDVRNAVGSDRRRSLKSQDLQRKDPDRVNDICRRKIVRGEAVVIVRHHVIEIKKLTFQH